MNIIATKTGRLILAILVASCALAPVAAAPRQAAPRGQGHAPRAGGPSHAGGGSVHSVPYRANGGAVRTAPRTTAVRTTAAGVARYGHYGYNGYGYGYGSYPCWGGYYPWWGGGWYGYWGWPYYSFGYGYGYGPWYGGYAGDYVMGGEGDGYDAEEPAPHPTGPAVVETNITPAKAEVLLDGESVGYASDYNGRWDKLSVSPGHHTISFQAKGYRTLVVEFEAQPGARLNFGDALVRGEGEDRRALAAEPAPPAHPETGRLRVRIEPGDTAVYLDGNYLGLAAELARVHGALSVPTGSHRLEAVRPGYVSAARVIEVGGADVVSVELALAAQP